MIIRVKRIIFAFCLLLSMPAFSSAQDIDQSFLKGHETALAVDFHKYRNFNGLAGSPGVHFEPPKFASCKTLANFGEISPASKAGEADPP